MNGYEWLSKYNHKYTCNVRYETNSETVICLPISSWSLYPCCYPDNRPIRYEYARKK